MGFISDVGDFFEDLWDGLWGENDWESGGSSSGSGGGSDDDDDGTYGPPIAPGFGENGNNEVYVPKTFDEWLKDQGLSQDVESEDYFGAFYEKTADSLVEQAFENKRKTITQAENIANKQGTASHTAYDIASNNFSKRSEQTFTKGLSNSGFSNYLSGISYLAYRDEIGENAESKQDAITSANNNYGDQKNDAYKDMNDDIQKREDELLNQYNKYANK